MSHAGPLTIWLKRVLWCPSRSYPWSIRACCSLVLPTCAKHSSQHYLHSQYELVYNPVYRLHSEQFDRLCPEQWRLWALFDEIVWAKAWTQTFLLHYCVHRFLCRKPKCPKLTSGNMMKREWQELALCLLGKNCGWKRAEIVDNHRWWNTAQSWNKK